MSRNHSFLIDAGIWLLSERAVSCLMNTCAWDDEKQSFKNKLPDSYNLYGNWALSLSEKPLKVNSEISNLTTAVVPLLDAGFYHFGTNEDLIQSLYDIQNLVSDQSKLGAVATLAQPKQFIQNADFKPILNQKSNQFIWIENSSLPVPWNLGSRNIISGVPDNNWELNVPDGVCIDLVPVESHKVIRTYGFADLFRGALNDSRTLYLGRPFSKWLEARNLSFESAGLDP